ncbi:transposable element Tcb2 transposase [Trichonephila clavipes]|nr:transposable element Tcb2 transposase [Trichonephila clavipes]
MNYINISLLAINCHKLPSIAIYSGPKSPKEKTREPVTSFRDVFLDAMGSDYAFKDDNARPHRTHIVDKFHEIADIHHMDLILRSPYHNSTEYVCDGLGKAIFQYSSLSRTSQKLKVPVLETWALMPQITIDPLINSMEAHCETCTAIHSGHNARGKCFISDS